MATERLEMRKIRETLRLRWQQGLTVRQVARSLGISVGVVQKMVMRAAAAGLDWHGVEALDEVALEERLYGRPPAPAESRVRPDPVYIHKELRRAGVTLMLLHLEYLRDHPGGLQYTAFCDVYRRWLATAGVVMRQTHKAGEKTFVDYSGKKPAYFDPTTGERIEVELFVAVLGASNYTYTEATETQRVADFIGSHVRAYAYFDGVTEITVPDQLKSAITLPCRYEPGVQRTYGEMARHYGTAIVPARPYKARDKPKVEVGVQIAQRWILARLRNETFFSLTALNARIAELREELNTRPMKKLGGATRRELYERYDRPALRSLPQEGYELREWKQVRVNLDYHVEVDKHWYSAPYVLVHEQLWACATTRTVELFHRDQRVASHARSWEPYKHTTDPAHMPEAHRQHAAGPDGVIAWAASVGPMTTAMVQRLFDSNPVREQGWRSARGLQRIGEKYGPERTELACERALRFGARSYKPVANILALGRERMPLPGEEDTIQTTPIEHNNVRGPSYYN
jgi:transposase